MPIPKKQTHQEKRTIILQFSSVVEKDLNASIRLTSSFISAFRQWLLSRRFKSSEFSNFANCLPAHLELQKVESTSLFTVIRSPFVYKKTREQFGLNKKTWRIHLSLSSTQQVRLLQLLTQLKLPAELTIQIR